MRSILISIHIAGIIVAITGCSWKPIKAATPVQFRQSLGGRPMPPLAPSQVAIYDVSGRLPEGVRANDGVMAREDIIKLEREYPTREQPHVELGKVYTLAPVGPRDDIRAIVGHLAAEAGKRGANTLVVGPCYPGLSCSGVALYLSSAVPNTQYPTAAEQLKVRPGELPPGGGFELALTPSSLAGPEQLRIPGKRGRCYEVYLVLEKDAALSERARRRLAVRVTRANEEPMDVSVEHDIPRAHRFFNEKLGCPQRDGAMAVDFLAPADANPATEHDLGAGNAVLGVYSWTIDEAGLVKEAQKEAQKEEEWKREEAEAERDASVRAQQESAAKAQREAICKLCSRAEEVCSKNGLSFQECRQRKADCLKTHDVGAIHCP